MVLGGVDRNSRLLELAKENIPDAQWFHEDLLDSVALERVFAAFAPDTVILRFVMQHLNPSECRRILDALFRLRSMHSFQLILEDPDDSKIEHYPFSQALESAIHGVMAKQAANGGDRTRGSQLLALCREAGFLKVSFEVVDFGSLSIGWEGVREILLPLWRQGCASEKELEGVMEWLAAATSIETNAKLRSPVFIVHA